MKLSSQFTVPAPPDKVVALFFDPATMRDCLPGCEELHQVDEKTYRGVLTNEVAHVKFKAGFSAVIESVKEPVNGADTTVVTAVLKGEDRRLGSTIKVDATMTITPVGQESRIGYEFEMAMWGKLGRLGEPVIRRRSSEVERQFSEALSAVITGRPISHRQAPDKKSAPRAVDPAEDVASQLESSATGQVTAAPKAPVMDRKQDLPFIVAVATAAFAWGVILGNRKRGR